MTDNELFKIVGIFVFFCAVFVVFLDRRSKKKSPMSLGQISLPIRIICFVFGMIFGGMAILGVLFVGTISLMQLVISVFLMVCAFYPSSKKGSDQEKISGTTITTNLESSIDPFDLHKSNVIDEFHNPASNSILRIGFYLLVFVIFLLWAGGVWYLSK